MMKKISLFTFCFIFIFSCICMPFSYRVHADQVAGSSPIIGVNISVLDYETERIIDSYKVSLTDSATRWRCVSFNSSGACNAYGSADSSNNYVSHQIIGDFETTNTYYDLTERIYKYEFILDSSYVGSITFSNSFGNNNNATYFINGSSFVVTASSLVRTFNVSTYSLNRNSFDTWQFPIESFNICSFNLNTNPGRYIGINQTSDYYFPIFRVHSGDVVYSATVSNNDNWIQTFIFYIQGSCNSVNTFGNFFTLSDGEILSYKTINRFRMEGVLGYLCQVTIGNFSAANVTMNITYNNSTDRIFMPVYCNSQVYNKNVSTDFALVFGMSNQLLDDLHYIAQNFQPSQEVDNAVDNLDDKTDDLGSNLDNMVQTEEGYSNDFNNALNTIDFSDPVSNNQGLLSSANFVISVFNGLTQNNFIGTFIVIILVLVIGKKVIGK